MKIGKTKLKLFLTSISIIAVSAFLLVSTGYAASIVSSESCSYPYHSSSSNGTTNSTTAWQALGTSAATGNSGVTWTTDTNLDTASWGNADLYVGQEVTFKFTMYSDNQGTHYGNVFKAWLASAGDETFDNSDVVASGFSKVTNNTAGSSVEYYSDTITITEAMIGTAYLRARVTCTESILSQYISNACWSEQWKYSAEQYMNAFDAYYGYYQGEIEEWAITIHGQDPGSTSPVPEPATFALFGIGLLGFAGLSRRKDQ